QAGRLPDPRRPGEGVEEVRPQEGPQGAAVLEAVARGPAAASTPVSLSFGTDGVRGLANAELTPELALALGRATARVLGPTPSVVVGRDTRRSGPMLEAAFVAGLAAEGVDALLLGVAPTPAVAWVSADAGIPGAVVSASHNPFGDNGIKLFAAGGRKLTDEVEAAVEAAVAEARAGAPADPPTGAA